MPDNEEQSSLFDMPEDWENEWVGMPEYSHKNLKPVKQIIVSFETYEDMLKFGDLIGQPLTRKTPSIWFPAVTIEKAVGFRRVSDES